MNNDKSWENEPDLKEFEYKRFKCLIRRHERLLHLCGYVFVPENTKTRNLIVHGGITWEGTIHDYKDYCIGFDCGHAGDLIPGFMKFSPFSSLHDSKLSHYWTMDEVEEELKKLVDQL